MTTPDAPRGGKAQGSGAGAADGRIRRTDPARSGPKRSSATAANNAAATTGLGAAPSPEATEATATDTKVSEAVARAVKAGYDVIEKNIRQGREAAERFRQGEYSIGDAPDDIEAAARRVLDLARVLSTSTFDVCERLLKELGTQTKTWSAAVGAPPPFRHQDDYPSPAKAKASSSPASTAADTPLSASAKARSDTAASAARPMKVTVVFPGGRGVAHTTFLAHPRSPTEPSYISAGPLASAEAGAEPISGVTFHADDSGEALIALVPVPEGQAPGVYSALVHARKDRVPLGVLTIEVPK